MGHAGRPSQYAIAVPQYSVARFCTSAPRPGLVLVVRLALSETPPRHAGHAVRPSQYAIDVPQYSMARFRRYGRGPRRELVLILSQAVPTLAQQLLLRRAGRPRAPSTRRRGPVVFN